MSTPRHSRVVVVIKYTCDFFYEYVFMFVCTGSQMCMGMCVCLGIYLLGDRFSVAWGSSIRLDLLAIEPKESSVSTSLTCDYKHTSCLAIFHGFWGANSDPYVFMASMLIIELSP